jgi:hypothetical protein
LAAAARVSILVGALLAADPAVLPTFARATVRVARASERVTALMDLVRHASSDKVRVQAAIALGRLRDGRATPALCEALDDESAPVRAMAARALGQIGDPSARQPLERATHDPSAFVRERAGEALRIIAGGAPTGAVQAHNSANGQKIFLTVGSIGDKTGRAPPALRQSMREFVLAELRGTSFVTVGGTAASARGFIVDGSIRDLAWKPRGAYVETSCEVELVVSTYPTHSMLMMTTGGASVQTPRLRYRPAQRSSDEVDALQNAVQGAHQNLVKFLQAQR